jgi:glycogen debranching enzyme
MERKQLDSEWLVTDTRGLFAMGTVEGPRTRKYHGFLMGIAGRTETAFLADLDLRLNGQSLWPHFYASAEGPVVDPQPMAPGVKSFVYEAGRAGPLWHWDFQTEEGTEGEREPERKSARLTFAVEAGEAGGIRLLWKWKGPPKGWPALLEIRPFWAMRPLHAIGGAKWQLLLDRRDGHDSVARISRLASALGTGTGMEARIAMDGEFVWRDDPVWFRNFVYSEETARGYDDREDLFSAGVFSIDLKTGSRRGVAHWMLGTLGSLAHGEPAASPEKLPRFRARVPALDFALLDPPGIVAGYPWFGEWGRDTFISLPGIAVAWRRAGGDVEQVWNWARDILRRWGEWIPVRGMIPNLIEKGGAPQWESSDGTLWWCHALASLWTFSLGEGCPFPWIESELRREFREPLNLAIEAMRSGRHRALALSSEGLLEVTEGHSTWMDARIEGKAVTPRVGLLPEINALWFQARCLQWQWSGMDALSTQLEGIKKLGRMALQCREANRPNEIFLHSIPLAPSFVLKDNDALTAQMGGLMDANLWTPVGPRTLSPKHPNYRPRYDGDQNARDQSYHQGPPWGWIGGHFEMARERMNNSSIQSLQPGTAPLNGPIDGHLPELFDAEPPFSPRGTPAQAWSLACYEEAATRRKTKVDSKLTQVLARRWLEQLDKPSDRPMGL